MHYLILVCFIIACGACNNHQPIPENEAANASEPSSPKKEDDFKNFFDTNLATTTCYMKVLKRDTMVILLEERSNRVTGKLTFDNYEKDGSYGYVRGLREGDLMKLVYYFSSEGMNSVMEVFFKKEGDNLIRGIGDMQTKGDSAYFENPEKVKYPLEGNFTKLDCQLVPLKYRQ